MLGPVGVGTDVYQVEKYGYPFFDTARLLGVIALAFGTSTSTLRDLGACWQVTGPRLRFPRQADQAKWAATRLKNRGLEQIQETTLRVLDNLDHDLDEVRTYFQGGGRVGRSARENVSRFLEPGLMKGARGHECWSYNFLKSQGGRDFKLPLPEVVAATIGVGHAAIGRAGTDRLLVLPVPDAGAESRHVTIGPFLTFDEDYAHSAGSATVATGLALRLMTQVAGRVKLRDFAFSRHGPRGFYESGLLGLHHVPRLWHGVAEEALKDCDLFLWRTRWRSDLTNVARQVAEFVRSPVLSRLEAITRAKARLQAGVSTARIAGALFGSFQAVEGVVEMVAGENRRVESEPLAKATASALNSIGVRRHSGDKADDENRAWVGWFTRLENAGSPERFMEELERLMARVAFAGEGPLRNWHLAAINGLLDCFQENFRLYRRVFLLQVLCSLTGSQKKGGAKSGD